MGHYLVVAHQTATSPELIARVRALGTLDGEAVFTLLIPATHPTHLLHWDPDSRFVWDEQRARAIALSRASEARFHFERAGLRVERAVIGDASPLLAIEDELRERPEGYDTIVLSTLPAGRSRWLASGVEDRVAEFGLPVVHVGGMPSARRRLLPRLRGPRMVRTALADARTGTWVIAALMLVYLAGSATLALTQDRGFFLNDAVALVTFAVLLGSLALWDREGRAAGPGE